MAFDELVAQLLRAYKEAPHIDIYALYRRDSGLADWY